MAGGTEPWAVSVDEELATDFAVLGAGHSYLCSRDGSYAARVDGDGCGTSGQVCDMGVVLRCSAPARHELACVMLQYSSEQARFCCCLIHFADLPCERTEVPPL